MLYTIEECTDDLVKFEELPHSFAKEEIRKNFCLAAAQTYASCLVTECSEACTHPRAGPPSLHLEAFLSGSAGVEQRCW